MHPKLKLFTDKSLKLVIRFWQCIVNLYQQTATFLKIHWPGTKSRLEIYSRLMRLDRPIGIFLLLWPTLWGLWIAAEGFPDRDVLIVFCLGVFLMRSAGCVLNDIADRRFDPMVSRTQTRPLAAGEVTPLEALGVALTLIGIAFLLVLTMNKLTIQLAFVAVILAAIYPFMKRHTYLPQFFLVAVNKTG